MVAHVLAVVFGLSSVGFYVAAFFYPEVHRRSDIALSGAGMLYAVLLWFCAGQMSAVVLLTQVLAIALLIFLGWQTLSIRREKTPIYQQTPVTLTPEVVGVWAKNTINQLRIAPADKLRPLRPQNPSLNGTSADRFRQPLDPRRRPVYDYEFVEDGIADEMPDEAVVDDVAALVDEVPDLAVPSVVAEVIVSEVLDAEVPEIEVLETETSEAETSEVEASVAESAVETAEVAVEDAIAASDEISTDSNWADTADLTSEPVTETDPAADSNTPHELTADNETADFDDDAALLTEQTVTEQKISTKKSVTETTAAVAENASTDESDDWGLDLEADFEKVDNFDDKVEKAFPQPAFSHAGSSAEKPAIWSMPLILVGWVKDMVTSMTKPKPSKPMIEIPRRESSYIHRNESGRSNERVVDKKAVNNREDREKSRPEAAELSREPADPPIDNSDPTSRAEHVSAASDFTADSNDANFDDDDAKDDDAKADNWSDNWDQGPERTLSASPNGRPEEKTEESNWDD
ncbi:MAG: Ycf66 family protein [Cyanobacteria bacterium J06621_11]